MRKSCVNIYDKSHVNFTQKSSCKFKTICARFCLTSSTTFASVVGQSAMSLVAFQSY